MRTGVINTTHSEGRTGNQRDEWMSDAACAETAPDMFFPDKGGSTREVKRVCAVCPVVAECLEFAMRNGYYDGVYGGLSGLERRQLRKKARKGAA